MTQFINACPTEAIQAGLNHLKEKKNIKTTAYVIMPNHLHCILFFPSADFYLDKIISNAKRFIAYKIVKRLEETNQTEMLKQLENAVTAKEKAKGQIHKAFEESFDAKSIDNKKFLLQKINYYI